MSMALDVSGSPTRRLGSRPAEAAALGSPDVASLADVRWLWGRARRWDTPFVSFTDLLRRGRLGDLEDGVWCGGSAC